MQKDMHYYGTYALARAAGLKVKDARVIAYAAEYVDDATVNSSKVHKDGGMFETRASAHTNKEVIKNAVADHTEQRHVWVPFHFFPGNEGDTLSEKLVCVKDSDLAQQMVKNHIRHAVSVKSEYGLAMIGVMAHVYADTFAHYGFSGVSSRNNKVDGKSFELEVKNPEVKAYIMNRMSSFLTKYTPSFMIKNYRSVASRGANSVTGALGHGGVGTYPDRPFLKWRFRFKENNKDSGWRDNPATYMEACEKLHAAFSEFAERAEISENAVPFESIRGKIDEILRLEADKEGRIDAWIKAIHNNDLFKKDDNEILHYSKEDWDRQRDDFKKLNHSHEIRDREVYQFHQAVNYHQSYTLKNLLPKHGIVVL